VFSLARCRSPLRLLLLQVLRVRAVSGFPDAAHDVYRRCLHRGVAAPMLTAPSAFSGISDSLAGDRVSATADLLEVPA